MNNALDIQQSIGRYVYLADTQIIDNSQVYIVKGHHLKSRLEAFVLSWDQEVHGFKPKVKSKGSRNKVSTTR